MKVCQIIFGVLVACAVSLAVEHGPLLAALEPGMAPELEESVVLIDPHTGRQKRSLLLGAGLVGGAGLLGAAALGAGAVGLGAGLVGAKAGLIGGALASGALGHGRSYGGGWGYGGGYGGGYGSGYYGGGYGGGYYGGGYGGGYRSYYPTTTYVVSDPWC